MRSSLLRYRLLFLTLLAMASVGFGPPTFAANWYPSPEEFIAVEPPRNETEALWENFLECVRSRNQSTFCPPDLAETAEKVGRVYRILARDIEAFFSQPDTPTNTPA